MHTSTHSEQPSTPRPSLTAGELRATGALSAIFASRLLGLFMIYPIFLVYAANLRGATPALIGLALGGYGLTQGLLQIPFGVLSDRVGRKRMIVIGLVLFALGSVIAAMSTSIWGVLIGRLLQGTGAIGSVVLAFVADVTREEVRTRAMAVVGMTIGFSFVVALILGPLVAGPFGMSGVFWLTAVFALVGIAVVYGLVPDVAASPKSSVPALSHLGRVIRNPELLRLDFGVGALNAALTACFLAVPALLTGTLHLQSTRAWELYLPVLFVALIFMVPSIIIAEKRRKLKEALLISITAVTASLLALALWGTQPAVLIVALTVFFTAFNVLEALLPSLVTRMAPADAKGLATGTYSSAQFIGIFVGGALGGLMLAWGGVSAVLLLAFALTLVWLPVATTMRAPVRHG